MQNLNDIKGNFKKNINGQPVNLHVLENEQGTQVGICNYGARITHFILKDRNNVFVDVILGFNTIAEYENSKERYHGVTVGPFANRIANGSFSINGTPYQLEKNNGTNCLHGGSAGFHDKVWDFKEKTIDSVSLSILTSKNEGGFPGELSVTIKYSLNNENELLMEYFAESGNNTYINLTNHAYFNLNGSGSIVSHQVKIEADKFAAIDEDCIPNPGLMTVEGTPFDFRIFKSIDTDISNNHEQLELGNGYDHSFEIKKVENDSVSLAATVIGDLSGLKLEVLTTEPAVQFYTGNFLGGNDLGKNNEVYENRSGFCLETQHHPDSPNQSTFPSTLLKGGDKFYSKTIYRISK